MLVSRALRPIGIAVVLLLAACTPRPTPTPQPTQTPTVVATPVPESPHFRVDSRASIINYTTFGPAGLQFPGTFNTSGNAIVLVPEGEGYRVKIDVVIDGKSVTAVNGLVRGALYNGLEIDKYPFGHFVADSKQLIHLTNPEPIQFTASGTLELHGRTRQIDLPVTMTVRDGRLQAAAETTVDLLDFEVNVPTAIINSRTNFKVLIVAAQDSSTATAAVTQPH